MSIVPNEVAGAPITSDQAQYLNGFFSGIKNRGIGFADAEPSAGPVPRTKKLTPEEQIKQEKHPFDSLGDLRAKAKAGVAPTKEEVFRFKWNGLFWLAPVHEGYMCRLRLPGGKISAGQFRELASIADDIASGYLQLTTRSNIQIRVIEPKNTLELLYRFESCGLKSRGSGADNLRNFTSSPTSGYDPYEMIDVLPFVEDLAHLVVNSDEFYDLPRKFNISYDNGGLIAVAEDTNDIGMRAVKKDGEVYFRILLGGVTGHQEFAEDCGFLCRPEDSVEVCAAITRVWMQHGKRDSRTKARLIYLIKEWGYAKYMGEVQKLLGYELIPFRAEELDVVGKPAVPHPHVGVYPQKQAGLNYVGVYVPVGILQTDQARKLAAIAEEYGSGDMRLSIYQNVIIPNIPDDKVEAVKNALDSAGLGCEASLIRGGAAACTGNRHCKFASSDTKSHTLELIEYLEQRLTLDRPINIHTTGCPHSCAQHYIGDIGLLACKVKEEGASEAVEGYHVFVGGGFGEGRKQVGRQLLKSIPAGPVLYAKIEMLLRAYLLHRLPEEDFLEFTSSRDIETLTSFVIQ
jgi:ferredoxin-nitrite reductase